MAVMTRNRLRMTTEATEVSINTILPEELMIEILSRIELSNPLELRCVCKWWKSIVADPQFVESYLHRSFSDVLDLTSTAMEHVESFESHDIYLPADLQDDEDDDEEDDDDVTELLVNKAAQLDNFLVILECMKGNLNTMKVDVISLKRRMKCLESFLKIYLKSAPSLFSSV
ncbi:putative F-box protein At3g19560 [Lathyrus oleraceus]|uniref:F-box domain-containing protein n=1 Tax=Pisum sativum TaxID=3888 RepID=A0A9D5GZY8_PEA|nr:putative F-box protein At3g19560 [Pisum sativum]KAI5447316.1 hypothetical protein KIW84_014969 [Pisum sativum]